MEFYHAEGVIRFWIRFILIVLFVLIGLLGDVACHLRNQVRALRGRPVPISSTGGWLKGSKVFTTSFRLRRLPGGWLGLVMFFIAILTLAGDLVVSRLVNSVAIQTRCPFDTGLVVGKSVPDSYANRDSFAYRITTNAMAYAVVNNGKTGIFSKITNGTDFSAEDQDILGRWSCLKNGAQIEYNLMANTTTIASDLISKNLLYKTYSQHGITGTVINSEFQTFLSSASTFGPAGNNTVKLAVDMKDDTQAMRKYMQPMICILMALDQTTGNYSLIKESDTILWKINNATDLTTILYDWRSAFQGALYWNHHDTTTVAIPGFIELTMSGALDAITMLTGANSQLFGRDSGTTYGCLIRGTIVPVVVQVLVLVTAGIFVIVCLYTIYLSIAVRVAAKKYDANNRGGLRTSREIRDSVPNNTLDWMVHGAAQATHHVQRPAYSGLHDWNMVSDRTGAKPGAVVGGNLVITRSGTTPSTPMENGYGGASVPLNPAGAANGYGYNNGQPAMTGAPGTYFDQKTGYSAVQSREVH